MKRHDFTRWAMALAVIGLLVAACSSGGASSSQTNSTASTSSEPVSTTTEAEPIATVVPGVLTVAVPHFPYPGYIEGDVPTAPTSGYFVSMMNRVAEDLGLEINFISANFDAMMAMQFNDYDIMMTMLSVTPERQEKFDMTAPVDMFYEGILVREGTSTKTAEDVRNLRLGVCGTCSLWAYITDVIKPNVEPVAIAEELQKYDALLVGQIDGALGDLNVLLAKSFDPKYEGTEVACKFEPPGEGAWALPKGHAATDAVNASINAMWEDGTIDSLAQEYLVPLAGGGDPSAVPPCPSFG